MAGNFYYKNMAYPIQDWAADSTDGSSLNTLATVKDEYVSTLDNLGLGFYDGKTFKGIKHNTSLFGGTWASREWNPPSNFHFSGNAKFAHVGCAPVPDTNSLVWKSGVRNHSYGGTTYLCVTYYDNHLYYAVPTSATVPTSWTQASISAYANVVLVHMASGGGSGGYGNTTNPLVGYSKCCAGGGGGGGAYQLFIYRFDPAATSSNKTILCFTIGAGGTAPTSAGTAGNKGGTVYCRLNTFSGTLLAQCTGGGGGNGGVNGNSSVSGGAGGLASWSENSRTDCYSVQLIHGASGGAGYGGQHAATGNGGNGSNISTAFSFGSVCNNWGPWGTGQAGESFTAAKDVSYGGGGGGAGALSRGDSYASNTTIFNQIGLGGQGGNAWCTGGSDTGYTAPTDGGPGCVQVEYMGAHYTTAEIDAK